MSEESFNVYETYNSENQEGEEEEKEQELFAEADERNEYYEALFKGEGEEPGGGTEVLKRHFQMDLEKQHRKSIMPKK